MDFSHHNFCRHFPSFFKYKSKAFLYLHLVGYLDSFNWSYSLKILYLHQLIHIHQSILEFELGFEDFNFITKSIMLLIAIIQKFKKFYLWHLHLFMIVLNFQNLHILKIKLTLSHFNLVIIIKAILRIIIRLRFHL